MFIQPKTLLFCQEATIAEIWNDLPGSHLGHPIDAPLGDEVVEKLQFGLMEKLG